MLRCSTEASPCFFSCLALMAASLAFLYLSRCCWVMRCLAWARTLLNIGAFLNIEGTMTKRICEPRRQTCSTGIDRPSLENMVTSSRRTFMVSSASARKPRNISPDFISTVTTWCLASCSSFTGAPIILILQGKFIILLQMMENNSHLTRQIPITNTIKNHHTQQFQLILSDIHKHLLQYIQMQEENQDDNLDILSQISNKVPLSNRDMENISSRSGSSGQSYSSLRQAVGHVQNLQESQNNLQSRHEALEAEVKTRLEALEAEVRTRHEALEAVVRTRHEALEAKLGSIETIITKVEGHMANQEIGSRGQRSHSPSHSPHSRSRSRSRSRGHQQRATQGTRAPVSKKAKMKILQLVRRGLLSQEDAADMVGRQPRTIRRWLKEQ